MAPSKTISIAIVLVSCVAAFLYLHHLGLQPPLLWASSKHTTISEEMDFHADVFTPEVLLSAPRRSPAVPDPSGQLAVYTVATYSFESHEKSSEIKIIDIVGGRSTLISNKKEDSEPNWLGTSKELIWLRKGEKGATELVVGSAKNHGHTYVAALVPGPISNLKLQELGAGQIAVAFSGKSWPNGTLYNADEEPKKHTSARLYESTMVRHWDEYVTLQKNAIWYGTLEKLSGRWKLGSLTNALKDTRLESPMPPFGAKDHFDISSTGLLYVAKDSSLNPAFNTKCNLYFIPITDFSDTPTSQPRIVELESLQGAASSPVFSPDGKSAAFLQMKQNGYESDRNQIVYLPDIAASQEEGDRSANALVLKLEKGNTEWDRSPSSVSFSPDGSMLLLAIEDASDEILFKIDLMGSSKNPSRHPVALTGPGAVSEVQPLKAGSNELFVSSSSLIDNSIYTIVDPAHPADTKLVSSNSRDGTSFGLSSEQVSEIWFQGSGDYQVHALVTKPSNFSPDKQYPLAYMIHGGPQVCWIDFVLPAVLLTLPYSRHGPNPGLLVGTQPCSPSKATL